MLPHSSRFLLAAALALPAPALAQTHPGAIGAPSDEPVPSKAATEISDDNDDKPVRLKGFDIDVTVFDSSGVYFAAEGYTQALSVELTPSYAFGKQWFKGTWAEKLSANMRLPIEAELTGNDPRFRGRAFGSSAHFDFPEQVVIDDNASVTTTGSVEGLTRQPVLLSDLWVGLSHGKLYVIPKLGIELSGNLRAVIPLSASSRNSGLITTVSLGLAAEREFGPVTVGYRFRPAKYFYSRSSPAPVPLSETVLINGRETTLWRPASTGDTNPHFGFSHSVEVTAKLPLHFSVNASYVLSQVAPLPLSGCLVEGVPTADVCRDGPRVSDLRGSAWREDHWFSAGVDYAWKALTFSLGFSTYRPLRNPDSTLSQLTLTAEALVRRLLALVPPPKLHLTSFHGVYAPHAALRPLVTQPPTQETQLSTVALRKAKTKQKTKRRLDWATLHRRTFGTDVLACPCGGRRTIRALHSTRKQAEQRLADLGITVPPWRLPPATAPPQLNLAV